MHGPVVHVGRDRLLNNSVESGVRVVSGVALSLLLVADEVLSGGLDTCILVTHDGLIHADSSEVWIG